MRILHMIPDIGISNGVMSVILNYAKAMPDDIKFDVIYFAEKDKTRKADIELLGGRVYKTDVPSPKSLLSGKMSEFFKQHKGEWQALHIHCPHFAVFIAPFAKAAGIKKIAVHCHTTEYSLSGNSRRNQMLSLYAKYFIKDKIACSNKAGKIWFGNKRFVVLNNAIDCKKYAFNSANRAKVRNRMNFKDSFVVCHIGKTNIKQKNHSFIFKVFSGIKKIKPNSKLMLIGAQQTDQTLLMCNELCIADDVMFLGVRNDVADLLQAADVLLFPSTSEGLPVSVIEAQAAGLPVIMSDSITNEVSVTDLVTVKSLNDSISSWVEECLKNCDLPRRNTTKALTDEGWNIFDTAKQLTLIYKSEVLL